LNEDIDDEDSDEIDPKWKEIAPIASDKPVIKSMTRFHSQHNNIKKTKKM
jgi:hypothetical protein